MIKRTLLLCTICILISGLCKSQQYKFIYYLDANLLTVPKSKAIIIGKGFNDKNGFQLDCYSTFSHALLMSWHFTDSSLAEIHGAFRSYHKNGKIEKEGNYVSGLEEGVWQTWDTLGRKTDSVFYKTGLPLMQSTYSYHKNGNLSYYTLKDSLQDTYQTTSYNENRIVSSEVFFKGQKGVLKRYQPSGVETDSLFTRKEIEASFPGGEDGWREYLRRNLNANVPADNKAPSGKYTVIIKFTVTKEGKVEDVFAETYHRYGMEQEAIRVIKNGPKWIPAVQYGRKVNAYRRQPVTFLIEN